VLGRRDQPALVLLHGFGAASGHWRHNAADLAAAGWCVYAIDLVGFGASSQPAHRRHRPLDNRLWARQVQDFLQQVVQGPAVLVGNSLGSLVAVTCAVFFPRWVLAVVAAPLPDPTLLMPMGRRRRPWRRRLQRQTVLVLCRLLPLELLVPFIARTPLLVLWGSQDRLVPPAISQRLAQHKPDLELQLLPQLGHCPHDERPALFNRTLLQWLERQAST
jgi:pimeloyl-ACP methyl ester carboxylesterase